MCWCDFFFIFSTTTASNFSDLFESLHVDNVVSIQHHDRQVVGVVRYTGMTEFTDVAIVGVELAFPSGMSDGDRKG